MNKNLDKKAIRERIEILRKKIQTKDFDPILEKNTDTKQKIQDNNYLDQENFSYTLETKTLIASILICFFIIGCTYVLSLKTNYLNIAANLIFKIFS